MCNALKRLFDYGIDQSSPVQEDYERKVKYDDQGNEVIEFVKVDYPAIQAALGPVSNWSLNVLLKAGISPNFSIHTGNPTRAEGLGQLNEIQRVADQLFAEETKTEE